MKGLPRIHSAWWAKRTLGIKNVIKKLDKSSHRLDRNNRFMVLSRIEPQYRSVYIVHGSLLAITSFAMFVFHGREGLRCRPTNHFAS
jgi:hypothetical protein